MDFAQKLKTLADNIDGFQGAVLSGMDGIQISTFSYDVNRLVGLEIELAGIINSVRATEKSFRLGAAEEMIVFSDDSILIMKLVGNSYFLALLLKSDGNLGKARIELKRLIQEFEKEIYL